MREKMTNNADPEVGNRIWTKFVLLDGNGTPFRVSDAPSTFIGPSGQRPTDEWLIEDGYRGYIDVLPPSYNKYEEKLIRTPIPDLPIEANNVIIQTFTVETLTPEEKSDMVEVLKQDINLDRDLRIVSGCTVAIANVGNLMITGHADDMRNLSNLGQLANMYIASNTNVTIPFRDDTNTIYSLTPEQMSYLWLKAVAYVSALYQASWNLKDSDPVPQDYQNPAYWPDRNV
jgi:hypothetical protein